MNICLRLYCSEHIIKIFVCYLATGVFFIGPAWRANVMVALLFSFEKNNNKQHTHKYECRMISTVVKKQRQRTERQRWREWKKNPLIHSPSVVLWAVHLKWTHLRYFFHWALECVCAHVRACECMPFFPISYIAIWNVSLLHCIVVGSVMREDHRVIEIHGRKKAKIPWNKFLTVGCALFLHVR